MSQQQVSLTLPVCGQYIGPSQHAVAALVQQLLGAEPDAVKTLSLVRELDAVAIWKPTSKSKARPQRRKAIFVRIIIFSLYIFKGNLNQLNAFLERSDLPNAFQDMDGYVRMFGDMRWIRCGY